MAQIDVEWGRVITNILENGTWQEPEDIRGKYTTDKAPAPAKFIIGERMKFDNSEALVPENKEMAIKSSLRELIAWMWQMKSNVVQDLRDMKCKIWNEWEIKEGLWKGTIGPAYGYILGLVCRKFPLDKFNWEHAQPGRVYKYDQELNIIWLDQVDYLIQTLLLNAGSRRIVTSLWQIEYLDDMALEPCVWRTKWAKEKNKMNLIVGIRSNDMCLGNNFNVFQYQVLQHLICQVVGLEVGTIEFEIEDAHIYDRHIDEAIAQVEYKPENPSKPKLWINPDITNFYRFDVNKDVKVLDYTPGPQRYFEVAE
jgi:thymidylate synthase